MSGIVLRDGNGNEVEYEGAKHLKVPCYNASGNRYTGKFTQISDLKAHIVSSEDGVNYTVVKYLSSIGANGLLFEFSDTQCEEFGYVNTDGSYKMMVFLYPETLTIGATYKIWDMI